MVLHSLPRLGGVIVGLWLAADRGAGALGFGSVCVIGVRTGMVARPGSTAVACTSWDRSR
jgi:hypothetical protein